MRVLALCPHFEPDTAPTGRMITEIVRRLGERGHTIEVVTSLPSYWRKAVEPEWTGRMVRTDRAEWGRITRVHPFPSDRTNIGLAVLASAGFTALVGAAGLFRRGRFDIVLAMSPPPTLALPAWIIARLRRARFVFNVQDAAGEVAITVGAIRGPSLVRFARSLERLVYRRADVVTVLSEDMAAKVAEVAERASKPVAGARGPRSLAARARARGAGARPEVRVIPNFVDVDEVHPIEGRSSYRAEFGLGDRTVVMYAGNVGFSQPLSLMIDAAQALAHRDDVVFVVNGGGSARARLETEAVGVANVVFVDYQPISRISEVLAAADIHVLALRRGLSRLSVPSKIYSVLAAGRPLLASIDIDSVPARVLTENSCGLVVAPEDPEAFVDAVSQLVDNPQLRRRMGERGRAWAEAQMTSTDVAATYERLFEDLAPRRRWIRRT